MTADTPDEVPTVLDGRHLVANAAGNVAQVAASIARALAWQPKQAHRSALVSDLLLARAALKRADDELHAAIVRVRLAQEQEDR